MASTIAMMRVALPLLILLGHFALCWLAWALGFMERHPLAASDAQTAFGGLFLLYWAIVLGAAWRNSEHNWLFRFLNTRGHAGVLAVLFGIAGVVFLVLGLMPLPV